MQPLGFYPSTCEDDGTEESPGPPFFFLLYLKIAVILLSRWARFDVRFQSLPYSLSLPCAEGGGMLLTHCQECLTTAAMKHVSERAAHI